MRTGVNLVRLFAVLARADHPRLCAGGCSRRSRPTMPTRPAGPTTSPPSCTRSKPGTPFAVPEVLFRKLTDDDIAAWTERFGGEAEAKSA